MSCACVPTCTLDRSHDLRHSLVAVSLGSATPASQRMSDVPCRYSGLYDTHQLALWCLIVGSRVVPGGLPRKLPTTGQTMLVELFDEFQ